VRRGDKSTVFVALRLQLLGHVGELAVELGEHGLLLHGLIHLQPAR
jgi:hypothetical protein